MSRSSSDLKMNVLAVRQELDHALRGALGHGHGVDINQIKTMNATLASMFRTLPQNEQNRVGSATMRYMVERYFSIRHGWIIKGFEPHANRSSQVREDSGILGSKVPGFIEAVLEKELQHGGFALEDVLTMVIVVERLIFDEVIRTVEKAYLLNDMQLSSGLKRDELMKVLQSYLIVEMLERHTTTQEEHDEDKENIVDLYPNWPAAYSFMEDIVGSETTRHQHTKNPFIDHSYYSFDEAAQIAQRISNEYGEWGNQECVALQDVLAGMDPHATGRILLTDFYRAGDGGDWGFQESTEYLRQLGSLDESSPTRGPSVIIPNYVYGMSNCLSSTPYYSVCCLNQCEEILQQFEKNLAKPTATPTDVLAVAELILSPENISVSLRTRLSEVAAHHGGKLPLHGRLFAQWLHYAFPHKCPFPHMTGTVRPLTQSEWKAAGKDILVEEDERNRLFANGQNVTSSEPLAEDADMLWSFDEEVLLSPEPPMRKAQQSSCWHLLPSMVALGILVVVVYLQKGMAAAAIRHLSTLKVESKLEYKSHLV
jgi:hypothetical protein